MPAPTSSTTLQRPDLGAVAYEYMLEASERGFIGLSILPIFPVEKQSADYPKIPIEALIKIPETKRSPKGNYNRGDYEFETGTYACEEYGWEEPVDDGQAALYRRFFDAEEIATRRAVDIILRGQEARISAAVFNTGNITGTANVGTEWSTVATCTPRADVEANKLSMRAASGLLADTMVISYKVFRCLMRTAEILAAFRYTNPVELGGEEVQKALLAQYFGIGRVLVGGAIKDSAKKGQAVSIADLWDDEYCGLFKVSDGGQDLREPCLGRTFLWTADSPSNLVTEQYREEQTRSWVYRVRQNVDEAFIFTGAGWLIGNIYA